MEDDLPFLVDKLASPGAQSREQRAHTIGVQRSNRSHGRGGGGGEEHDRAYYRKIEELEPELHEQSSDDVDSNSTCSWSWRVHAHGKETENWVGSAN